jgi:hypothetical protein
VDLVPDRFFGAASRCVHPGPDFRPAHRCVGGRIRGGPCGVGSFPGGQWACRSVPQVPAVAGGDGPPEFTQRQVGPWPRGSGILKPYLPRSGRLVPGTGLLRFVATGPRPRFAGLPDTLHRTRHAHRPAGGPGGPAGLGLTHPGDAPRREWFTGGRIDMPTLWGGALPKTPARMVMDPLELIVSTVSGPARTKIFGPTS